MDDIYSAKDQKTQRNLLSKPMGIADTHLALQFMASKPYFDDLYFQIGTGLSRTYEDNQDYDDAIKVMQNIPLDQRNDREKVDCWMRIVRLSLELSDIHTTDMYLSKVAMVIETRKEVLIQITASQAGSLDFKKSYSMAALKYYELSRQELVDIDERSECFRNAMVCAVLAKAGTNRILDQIYDDERCELYPVEYQIVKLRKLNRIIQVKGETKIEDFAKLLKPHQVASSEYIRSSLTTSLIEHNLYAASLIYRNIKVSEMGLIVGVPDEVEVCRLVGEMIEEGRMAGKIDQVDGYIEFEGHRSNRVEAVCRELMTVSDLILSFDDLIK